MSFSWISPALGLHLLLLFGQRLGLRLRRLRIFRLCLFEFLRVADDRRDVLVERAEALNRLQGPHRRSHVVDAAGEAARLQEAMHIVIKEARAVGTHRRLDQLDAVGHCAVRQLGRIMLGHARLDRAIRIADLQEAREFCARLGIGVDRRMCRRLRRKQGFGVCHRLALLRLANSAALS